VRIAKGRLLANWKLVLIGYLTNGKAKKERLFKSIISSYTQKQIKFNQFWLLFMSLFERPFNSRDEIFYVLKHNWNEAKIKKKKNEQMKN
jgi:hypothetical protein